MNPTPHPVALITGAARRVGATIARRLHAAGFDVALHYRSPGADLDALVAELESARPGSTLALQADLADTAASAALVPAILARFGRLDALVNNAGITKDGLLLRMKEEDWDAVLDINLKSVFLVSKAALRLLLKSTQGRIVNVSSVVGVTGNPGQTNYAASKAGMIGFSKAMAREYATKGLCVNVVAPGFIESDMTGYLNEAQIAAALTQIPAGRMGTGDDVAATVSFLVSASASYVTGQVLCVDGGMAM